MKIILAVLVVVFGITLNLKLIESKSNRGYLLTAPRSFAKKSENELILNLYNVNAPGSISVKLLETGNGSVIAETNVKLEADQDTSVIKLYVPYTSEYEARFEIDGLFDTEDSYHIFGEDTVYFKDAYTRIVFIQTDKPLYKPGQKVKFRVLPLDGRLRPLSRDTIGDIWVEDPSSSRVAQWKGVSLGSGIRQLEFPLSEEPVKGIWKIRVKIDDETQQGQFEVKEYVLPKYEIIVTPPSYILANAESAAIDICAKYTYGKLVEGKITINATLETYHWSNEKYPTLEHEGDIEGCYTYNLNISVLDKDFQQNYRRIQFFVQITEKGTDIVRNATKYIDRTQSPLHLSFQTDRREYFKPGLPYRGELKVTHPDNSPASGEPCQICMIVSRERVLSEWWATRKVKYCKNFTSDENGQISYTVPPQNVDAVSMNIEAKSLKYTSTKSPTLYQPQTSTYLRPWFSPSGSHLQIQSEANTLQCESTSKIKILFTANGSADYRFYYEAINRGKVLRKDYVDVSFDAETDISSELCNEVNLDAEEIQLVPPPSVKEMESDSSSSESDVDNQCKAMKEVRYVPYVGEAEISLDITTAFSPSFQLLVYYINDDRETVADSQKFSVEKCFDNKVEFEFSEKVQQPGTKATFSLKASPDSLCGVKVVDKSITLLDSSNELTKEKVFEELQRFDSSYNYPRNHCSDRRIQPGLNQKKLTSEAYRIMYPPMWSSSTYEDTLTAFETAGFVVISDLTLLTRPCKNNQPTYEAYGGIALASRGGMNRGGYKKQQPAHHSLRRPAVAEAAEADSITSQATKSVVDVRSFFPESWLFEIENVGEDGVLVKKETLPHTITEWVGDAVCINSKDGLGISGKTGITGFQAFFLSYSLPYSVIRGEKIPVVVTVFNYLEKCLSISVDLEQSGGFLLLSESRQTDLCVCGGKSETHRFIIQPNIIGFVNLTVHGKTSESFDACGGMEVADVVAKDAIVKPLIIEAEGFPVEKVESTLFCPKDSEEGFQKEIEMVLPEGVVEGSSRGYLAISGDIMGPAIEGLDNLVRLPTGCGEQNMILFAPNVYVLDYLTSINELTENIKERALKNLKTGYQRELNYRHSDGAYSAFGSTDREGSIFLTSFVLRCFSQSENYIEIDAESLNQTRQWILSKQQKDGCFPEVGKTLSHGLKGGINDKNSLAPLTAYVLSSLLVAGLKNETIINLGLSCLEKEEKLTPYKAALFAYTAALAQSSAANKYLDKLFEKAEVTGDQTYWRNGNTSKSTDVETAAYALLALMRTNSSLQRSLPVVRWLTTNRNSNGGFSSTQDTVLGLESLSKFSSLAGKDPVNLDVIVTGDLEVQINIKEDDKLLVQKYKVSEIPAELQVEAKGSGCGILQSILRYNTIVPPKNYFFDLKVEAKRESEGSCKQATINTCVKYLPEGKKSNMAVIEIKMISGMVPLKESLKQLQSDRKLEVKRFDVNNNNVVLYFDELSNERKCFDFVVEEALTVEEVKPAVAKVYDYYAKEHSQETEYSVPLCE